MVVYKVEVKFSQHISDLFRVRGYEEKVRELTGGLATIDYTECLIYVDCYDLLQAEAIDEEIKKYIDEVLILNSEILDKIDAFRDLYNEIRSSKEIRTVVNTVRYDHSDLYNILLKDYD